MPVSANNDQLKLLDRDVSWLEFNHRVLHEAADERTPLLERLKFLAIVSSNLDEFFMKRMGVLKQKTHAHTSPLAGDLGAQEHQQAIRAKILAMTSEQASIYRKVIRPALAGQGIHLLDWEQLAEDERRQANELFRRKIYPVLTPLVVD